MPTNNILLGSDLEETTDPSTGWSAILDSPTLPNGKAIIFKVPHHGSKTSHAESIWSSMIDENNLSLLTCKAGGKSSLPTDKDIDRLKGYTDNLYCTSEPATKKVKRDRTVEKTMNGIVKKRKVLGGKIGHIQVRFGLDSGVNPQVSLEHPAKKL